MLKICSENHYKLPFICVHCFDILLLIINYSAYFKCFALITYEEKQCNLFILSQKTFFQMLLQFHFLTSSSKNTRLWFKFVHKKNCSSFFIKLKIYIPLGSGRMKKIDINTGTHALVLRELVGRYQCDKWKRNVTRYMI